MGKVATIIKGLYTYKGKYVVKGNDNLDLLDGKYIESLKKVELESNGVIYWYLSDSRDSYLITSKGDGIRWDTLDTAYRVNYSYTKELLECLRNYYNFTGKDLDILLWILSTMISKRGTLGIIDSISEDGKDCYISGLDMSVRDCGKTYLGAKGKLLEDISSRDLRYKVVLRINKDTLDMGYYMGVFSKRKMGYYKSNLLSKPTKNHRLLFDLANNIMYLQVIDIGVSSELVKIKEYKYNKFGVDCVEYRLKGAKLYLYVRLSYYELGVRIKDEIYISI